MVSRLEARGWGASQGGWTGDGKAAEAEGR